MSVDKVRRVNEVDPDVEEVDSDLRELPEAVGPPPHHLCVPEIPLPRSNGVPSGPRDFYLPATHPPSVHGNSATDQDSILPLKIRTGSWAGRKHGESARLAKRRHGGVKEQ